MRRPDFLPALLLCGGLALPLAAQNDPRAGGTGGAPSPAPNVVPDNVEKSQEARGHGAQRSAGSAHETYQKLDPAPEDQRNPRAGNRKHVSGPRGGAKPLKRQPRSPEPGIPTTDPEGRLHEGKAHDANRHEQDVNPGP
jgi:hypothetical protein